MEPEVEGEIFVPLTSSEEDRGTLDEPITTTLVRDSVRVSYGGACYKGATIKVCSPHAET